MESQWEYIPTTRRDGLCSQTCKEHVGTLTSYTATRSVARGAQHGRQSGAIAARAHHTPESQKLRHAELSLPCGEARLFAAYVGGGAVSPIGPRSGLREQNVILNALYAVACKCRVAEGIGFLGVGSSASTYTVPLPSFGSHGPNDRFTHCVTVDRVHVRHVSTPTATRLPVFDDPKTSSRDCLQRYRTTSAS